MASLTKETQMTMHKGEMLSKAMILMINGHAGQFDRGGKPYALHPLAVMHKLKTDDEELQCICVLHDYIEDVKGASYFGLRVEGMSDRVIEGVRCMTKVPGETPEEYEAKVLSNTDSIRVKMEDLRHNSDLRRLKGVTDKDVARTTKYMMMYHRLSVALKEKEQ
jgi:(p)ppGpp synthase/HD superfamily hydrolase